ncbi:unnamed protein product [Periconia digitata]|uniref:Uncharacterized protein n=1 Tax=Periconia digitata TaxID=1303443 RepID=A0A9W4UUA5_9PLEO|nr:unnamed protein product [Periconia digitata]
MCLFTIVLILAVLKSVSAINLTHVNRTSTTGLNTLFQFPTWANDSPLPVEVTVGIEIGGLAGSAIITLTNPSVDASSRVENPSNFSSKTVHRGPYETTNLTSCAANHSHNGTAASTGFGIPVGTMTSVGYTNETTGPSDKPFATPTPTAFSLLTSGAMLKKDEVNVILPLLVASTYFF